MSPHSRARSVASSEGDFQEADFDPGDSELFGESIASTGPFWFGDQDYYEDWSATSPDGMTIVEGSANQGVHVFGADCAFNLSWISEA